MTAALLFKIISLGWGFIGPELGTLTTSFSFLLVFINFELIFYFLVVFVLALKSDDMLIDELIGATFVDINGHFETRTIS